jgi:F-type H+-transporting ATPase subunit epsilon
MMTRLAFEIVTAERVVYSQEVDVVVAPSVDGQLAVLPQHAPLMTMLQPGEILVRMGEEEQSMFVSGGFMEVIGNRVTVLADTAERAEEIDTARAEEARQRAHERIALPSSEADQERARAAMMRSLMRLRVAEKRRKRRPQT